MDLNILVKDIANYNKFVSKNKKFVRKFLERNYFPLFNLNILITSTENEENDESHNLIDNCGIKNANYLWKILDNFDLKRIVYSDGTVSPFGKNKYGVRESNLFGELSKYLGSEKINFNTKEIYGDLVVKADVPLFENEDYQKFRNNIYKRKLTGSPFGHGVVERKILGESFLFDFFNNHVRVFK
jgi:hypothetical protein